MKHWKHALSVLSLATALGTERTSLSAEPPGKVTTRTDDATVVLTNPDRAQPELSDGRFGVGSKRESSGAQELRQKLEQITLTDVQYDSLPLGAVVEHLIQESAKLDPRKRGVNFLFGQNPTALEASVDPATGLPVAQPDQFDPKSVTIRILPALRHVRLIDVLDAITKVADRPIQYSIEEYAVVFTMASPSLADRAALASAQVGRVTLAANTFMVSSNDLILGAEKIFGVRIDTAHPGRMQSDLRQFLIRLGIDMDVRGKSVFYNDRSGILMVRATPADLELLTSAVNTLNGAAGGASQLPAGTRGTGGSASPAIDRAVGKPIEANGNAIPASPATNKP